MLPPRIIAGERLTRDLGSGRDRQPLGPGLSMNEMTTVISDGGVLVSVMLGDVVLRKVVYADGRFHVQIEEARDRLAFAGSPGRASLTYGAETVSFVPCADTRTLERARDLVASADVVATFRRMAERLGRYRRTSAGAVSVHLTAALVLEVVGEQGIALQITRLLSAPLRRPHVVYDGRDDFQERWTEHTAPLVAALESPSLERALRALLVMEAAWHAVVCASEPCGERRTR